jgi:predicted O-methyltransferase YrrM
LSDAVRKRFGEPAELIAELEDLRAAETQERLRRLLTLTGEERALDVGTGAGAFAIALARRILASSTTNPPTGSAK